MKEQETVEQNKTGINIRHGLVSVFQFKEENFFRLFLRPACAKVLSAGNGGDAVAHRTAALFHPCLLLPG